MSPTNVAPGTRYTVPPRTIAQRQAALLKANRVRGARAELKRQIAAGERDALDTLIAGVFTPELVTMPVADLMLAIPKLGDVKVRALLRRHRVSPQRTLGGLSIRQRLELAAAIMDWRRNLDAKRVRELNRARVSA